MMTERKKIFSRPRREFIARAIMDMVKLIFVAGVVGGFFASASTSLSRRIGGVVVLLMVFVISVATLPGKEG